MDERDIERKKGKASENKVKMRSSEKPEFFLFHAFHNLQTTEYPFFLTTLFSVPLSLSRNSAVSFCVKKMKKNVEEKHEQESLRDERPWGSLCLRKTFFIVAKTR